MRNKFSELLATGVANFNYTPITSDQPDTDPICRIYNNIFSIPSDTHMSITADGERIITGHMINTQHWKDFCCSFCWGAVDFRHAGTWSVAEFLYKNGLKGEITSLNGDVVYKITDRSPDDECQACALTPCQCNTLESQIPMPITTITTTGNKMHVIECFNNDVINNLNESTYIKGCNWVLFEDQIIGLINDKVYKLITKK